jgi:hypothetical protein
MDLKWRETHYGNRQLWWDDKFIRCAELGRRDSDRKWRLTLSYAVAPLSFVPDCATFDTLEEAMEHTENLVRVLIIGGHHEDRRTS